MLGPTEDLLVKVGNEITATRDSREGGWTLRQGDQQIVFTAEAFDCLVRVGEVALATGKIPRKKTEREEIEEAMLRG